MRKLHKIFPVEVNSKVTEPLCLTALSFYVKPLVVSGDTNTTHISFHKVNRIDGHAVGQP